MKVFAEGTRRVVDCYSGGVVYMASSNLRFMISHELGTSITRGWCRKRWVLPFQACAVACIAVACADPVATDASEETPRDASMEDPVASTSNEDFFEFDALEWNEVSPLGLSAAEAAQRFDGEYTAQLTYADGRRTELHLLVRSTGEPVGDFFPIEDEIVAAYAPAPAHSMFDNDEVPTLFLNVDLSFETEDGRFVEQANRPLRVLSSGRAIVDIYLRLVYVVGSYTPKDAGFTLECDEEANASAIDVLVEFGIADAGKETSGRLVERMASCQGDRFRRDVAEW